MKPNPLFLRQPKYFLRQPKYFWANVRTINQEIGYTAKGTGQIKVPSVANMSGVMERLGLNSSRAEQVKIEQARRGHGATWSQFEPHCESR